MAASRDLPDVYAHVSIFIVSRTRRDPVGFNTDPVPLTPARMKLLARLVEPDQWRRSARSRRTTWDDVQATVEKRLGTSN
jgi:hypothetical protein